MPSKKLASSILGLLVVQFILGMLANMYQEVPQSDPGSVFHHSGYILFHSYLAVLLLILAAIYLYQTIKRGGMKMPAIGGLVNILLAAVFGHVFVATGKDIYSLFMAIFFIGAIMSYARIVFSGQGKSANS